MRSHVSDDGPEMLWMQLKSIENAMTDCDLTPTGSESVRERICEGLHSVQRKVLGLPQPPQRFELDGLHDASVGELSADQFAICAENGDFLG